MLDTRVQMDNIVVYLEQKADTTPTKLLVVKCIHDHAALKRKKSVKESKLDQLIFQMCDVMHLLISAV